MWVGWRIIAQTAAENLAKSHAEAALRWVADQPAALNQLALREFVNPHGNLDSAREWAQRALRSNPLDAQALTLLGLIAERKGDQKSADTLIAISSARTWRNETANRWLFNREFRRGDYPHALAHVDAILRMDMNNGWGQFFPTLAAFTATPGAFEALTAFLATSPPWRTWFLSELSARLVDRARLVQLYAALKETENPPTNNELRPYLNQLIKDGNFEQAYRIWRETLPVTQRSHETYLFNRDFEIPIDGLPFNWDITSVPGADIQIVPSAEGGKNRALLVQFFGGRVTFANVKQLLLLPAGDYSLRGRLKSEALRTSRGLWWHIFCANDPTKTLGHTELLSGPMPWTDFAMKFEVPAKDCRAQWLQLELPARVDSESRIDGRIWYQDLQITPTLAAERKG
jgi:tetratricopeptide (TPR) repeat protein